MRSSEVTVFIVYLICMFAVGIYFFFKNKNGNEKTYFLGDRKMGAWVAALSAGAADMSAWVLMGLPTSIYALGLGQIWISVGLAIGYSASWLLEAPRLRKFSIVAGDAITIPQYLANRFLSKSRSLQALCAVVFLIAYTIYCASSIKACGTLFNTITGMEAEMAMYFAAFIIVGYTFLGGFSAVCWVDFFQGLLILGAMLIVPIFAAGMLDFNSMSMVSDSYWNILVDWKQIVSGLAWGLGYFGMPHIIIKFMSIKSQQELKKSAKIGIAWTLIIVTFAALIGVVGRLFLGFDEEINKNSLVFVATVHKIFPAIISGILLSAVLAAAMSTADSQLLAASSALANDIYKPLRKNQARDRELLWVGRIVVLIIAAISMLIAANPNSGSIMELVQNAWGVFGATFGPTIMLSLFWKRLNFTGAVAGILTGAVVDISWYVFLSSTGIYELAPGFFASLIVAIVVSLCTKSPSDEVKQLFVDAVNCKR
ncbi:MAG: sodium/proline symporter [Alphaproteobacteria bacterium]|nr:sodium/proline symporter [Alphaproteobacteria bacterium]MBO7537094.1 sodium/proline symporter [Alphaproteobacteria bacterium]MBO7641860.1 sodium/proline symporter [Alphaproteobacteria bacterium]